MEESLSTLTSNSHFGEFAEETLTKLEHLQSHLNWFTTDNAEMVWYDKSVGEENQ